MTKKEFIKEYCKKLCFYTTCPLKSKICSELKKTLKILEDNAMLDEPKLVPYLKI